MFWRTDSQTARPTTSHVAVPKKKTGPTTPEEFVAKAEADPAFQTIKARFLEAGVMNWLTEREKALHYGIAAFSTGDGTTVELGTFEGGAAMFLAAGTLRRGNGRVVCVDPHFGGPPWLGMGPPQRTLEKFKKHAQFCRVSDWIETRVGDSAAVAAVWPAEPVGVVFIDGDHSYLGALRDFECWAPKVPANGWVMIDDVDDACLPELLELVAELKALRGVTFVGQIDGVAVFRREDTPPEALLAEIRTMSEKRGLVRPWDQASLHKLQLAPTYAKSLTCHEPGAADAYQLAFLARCGPGAYGYTHGAGELGSKMMQAVCTDRREGLAVKLSIDRPVPCRAIFCHVSEVAKYAPYLIPGGVLITCNPDAPTQDTSLKVRTAMLDAGLEGCGWGGAFHWGVWRPFELSPDAVVRYTLKGYQPA